MSIVHQKRVTGFMPAAKTILVQTPGLTAQEVVDILKRSGKLPSAAKNPEGSLIATLHKHHRQYGLERRLDATGRYRYYVIGASQATPQPPTQTLSVDGGCCLTLPTDDRRRIQALIDLGRYPNEHGAYRDLIKKGLEAVLAKLSA